MALLAVFCLYRRCVSSLSAAREWVARLTLAFKHIISQMQQNVNRRLESRLYQRCFA